MSWFSKRASEEELTFAMLDVALLTHAEEVATRTPYYKNPGMVDRSIDRVLQKSGLKASPAQLANLKAAAQSLLREDAFLKELLDFRTKNKTAPWPRDYAVRGLELVAAMVQEFLRSRGKVE